ncbi:hypothetical protein Acr_12g0004990 [Actinidia rufa]|uniref:Uncharacterized protein n=1 Tax=Actinidia rufa TaxID=165716 RepID=A0A7J0FGY4_9ERIC|nr:hypothetical protein Acr_12g0004990 [Actinidia rufa]
MEGDGRGANFPVMFSGRRARDQHWQCEDSPLSRIQDLPIGPQSQDRNLSEPDHRLPRRPEKFEVAHGGSPANPRHRDRDGIGDRSRNRGKSNSTITRRNTNYLRRQKKSLLLRQNRPDLSNPLVSRYLSPGYDQIPSLSFSPLNERLRNLQIQRENCMMMMMKSNAIASANLDLDSFSRTDSSAMAQDYCEECESAREKGISAPFHFCVLDAVVIGFRPTAGPIARPRKAVP